MSDSGEPPTSTGEPSSKRFRSVREYREMKRLQKLARDRSVSPEPEENEPEQPGDPKEEFVKLLKDTIAHICYNKLGTVENTEDDSEVPEWRRVSRIISQTLLEKESRIPTDVRYKVTPEHAREAAIKRIQGYTRAYLDRKYSK